MWRQMLKSKIHRATVTGANIEYEGSITIDRDLLEAANMMMDEKVLVVNLTNGSRIESYAIPAERGSGTICLNGGAAKHGKVGDLLIIMSFGVLDEVEIKTHVPKLVKVDAKTRIITEDAKLRKAAR